MGHSITYDGTYLGSSTYGVLVLAAPRNAMADVRLDLQGYAARDGGVSQGSTLKFKFWTDQIHIGGTSWTNTQNRLDSVRFVLDPKNGAAALRYDEDLRFEATEQREYLARLNGPLLGNFISPYIFQTQLNWVAETGHARALSETTITPAIASSPDTFTIPEDGVSLVGGTATTRPVFIFRNTTGANVTSITFTNSTLSQTIRWTGVLPNNYYIKFDSERQHIERSSTGAFAGEETNAASGKTAGDPYPQLAPRVVNTFSLTGFSSATSSITFREEFL